MAARSSWCYSWYSDIARPLAFNWIKDNHSRGVCRSFYEVPLSHLSLCSLCSRRTCRNQDRKSSLWAGCSRTSWEAYSFPLYFLSILCCRTAYFETTIQADLTDLAARHSPHLGSRNSEESFEAVFIIFVECSFPTQILIFNINSSNHYCI